MGNHSKCFKCGELDEFCACRPAPTGGAPEAPASAQPVAAAPAAIPDVLNMVLDVVRLAYDAMDGTEENENGLVWDRASFDALSDAMDKLDDLPDDQPGYVMGPATKARWAMRAPAAPVAQATTASASEKADFANYFCMTLSCDGSESQELVDACRAAAHDAWMERARRAPAPSREKNA